MKKLFVGIIAAFLLAACGSNTPVSKLIDLMEEGTDLVVSNGGEEDSYMNRLSAIEEEMKALIKENRDLPITDRDKKDLLNAYISCSKKLAAIPGFNEDWEDSVDRIKEDLDDCETFGDVRDALDL